MSRLAEIEGRVRGLSKALGGPPRSTRGAVAIVLRGASAVDVLLIERAEREGDPWSGQIAFPGGKRERGDRSLLETAKREAREEVGVALGRARLAGWLPFRAPGNRVDWVVVPYVFSIAGNPRLRAGDEAARAFWTRLDALPASLHRATIEFSFGDFETPAFDVAGKPLWGFTFRVLCDLFDLVSWPPARTSGT